LPSAHVGLCVQLPRERRVLLMGAARLRTKASRSVLGGGVHLFQVFCMRARSPLSFLLMYLLFSLGPNTRTVLTASVLVRYM